ncbi:hypothetical protein CDL12_25223 [Handroanthus impetiginosus]|uniref:CRC domain-containing protein n=1 Tax=Handroanthus impetiginosus TaxID=429701 RepID=A0A2G9GAM4_9LAMI|nr:hypothetical protein CDL12_25223 [Handroanthus impetiginosus]
MEQSETAAGTVAAAPVVRQLDFTVNFKAMANANGNLILPEHPQAQLQSKLLALAQSRLVHAPAKSPSPPRMAAQTKLPPRKMVMPPKSPQRELPQMARQEKSPVIAPRLAHPVKPAPLPKPPLQPLLKTESPKTRERGNLEQGDGTPKKQKLCNCKNSRCLKLYCECFATGVYCDGCNCTNCYNKIEHEADRKESIDMILERNPNAFRPKIASSPHGPADRGAEHKKGCNCKKSGCLKRYCECFQANIVCSDKCKCMDCKNFEGSEERKAHFHQYSANSMAFIQQTANAAINGAIGTPSKKSRNQQIVFGVESNKQPNQLPQSHKETDPPRSPLSVHPSKPDAATLGLSKSSYRSPLSGILQLQHVNDFCTLLVEVSAEAARSLSEEREMMNNSTDLNAAEIPVVSSDEKEDRNQQNAMESCVNQDNRDRTLLCVSDDCGVQDGRPLSPGTLALMCDERDMIFMAANAPSTTTESNTRMNVMSVSTHGLSPLYVEQERLVLMRFRSFLNKLITCGSIEETKIEQAAD